MPEVHYKLSPALYKVAKIVRRDNIQTGTDLIVAISKKGERSYTGLTLSLDAEVRQAGFASVEHFIKICNNAQFQVPQLTSDQVKWSNRILLGIIGLIIIITLSYFSC